MNLDELLALPAGRELDAEIGRLLRLDIEVDDGLIFSPYYWRRVEYGPGHNWLLTDVPHYSTDIAAAWPLLAEMLRAGIGVQMEAVHDGLGLRFGPSYIRVSEWRAIRVPSLDAAPLAIARAWATWRLLAQAEAGASRMGP